jgi:GxxExxY protein
MNESQKENAKKQGFDDGTGDVIAAAIEVHRRLGPGFLESIYEQALRLELTKRGVPFVCQKRVLLTYDGQSIGDHVLDLLVNDTIVVELKAVKTLEDVHFAQVKSYLRATGLKIGLLLNFNSVTLVVKRVYP